MAADVESEVEFGLDQFAPERKVELPLRDALYAYKAVGEFIAFFHDPDKHPTIDDVNRFVGNNRKGALHVFWEVYYHRLRDVWPTDVQKAFNDGLLDRNPVSDK